MTSARAVATEVSAQITYRDAAGNELFVVRNARWSDAASRVHPESRMWIPYADFPPGATRSLDIACKSFGASDCFGIDYESPEHPYFENTAYRLSGERFIVEVQLMGGGIRETFLFELENDGPLSLRHVSGHRFGEAAEAL
jgi:hypothetical protein